jgi:hypothetical protein
MVAPAAKGPIPTFVTDSALPSGSRQDGGFQPNVYSNHYWYTADYNSTNFTTSHAVQIAYMSIFLPSAQPDSGDVYFELLNSADNLGDFDQIGVAADSGTWEVIWANVWYGPGGICGTGGTYGTALSLHEWTWYTFFMYLSGSSLQFRVYNGSANMNGTPYWTHSVSDSAYTFEINTTYPCKNAPSGQYGSFDPFQEVYDVGAWGQHWPAWDFYYGYTTIAWWGSGSWTDTGIPNSAYYDAGCSPSNTCPVPPQSYHWVYYNGASGRILTVANQVFREYFTSNVGSVYAGHTYYNNGSDTAQGSYCTGLKCIQSLATSLPSGWGGGAGGQGKYIPSTSYIDFYASPPSGTSPGLYILNCTVYVVSTTPYEETSYFFYLTVL